MAYANLNCVSGTSVVPTPCELWHGRKPSLDHFMPMLCRQPNLTHEHGKLGPRATKMTFIRYLEHSKGYVMFGEYLNSGMIPAMLTFLRMSSQV